MLVLDELPRVLRRALGHRVGEECHEAALAARLGGGLAVGQGDGLHLEVHILRRDTGTGVFVRTRARVRIWASVCVSATNIEGRDV